MNRTSLIIFLVFLGLIFLLSIILLFLFCYYVQAGKGVNKVVPLLPPVTIPEGTPADYRPVKITYKDMKRICCEDPNSSTCEETSSSKFLCDSCERSSSCSSTCDACSSSSSSSCHKGCSSSSSSSCKNGCSSSSSSSCSNGCSSSSSCDKGCKSSSSTCDNGCKSSSSCSSSSESCDRCDDNRDPCYYDPTVYFRRKGNSPDDACGLDGQCFGANDPCNSPKTYFSSKDKQIINFKGYEPSDILDIAQDGNKTIAILKSNNQTILVQRGDDMVVVSSKSRIDRIFSFRGDVYIISDGKLLSRDPECHSKRCWYWNVVQGLPTGIVWVAVTGDDEYMWLQTATQGYLYNCRRKLVQEVIMPGTTIRVFGRQKKAYAEVDTLTDKLTIHDCTKTFTDVGAAIFDQCNNLIFIRKDTLAYVSGLRLLEWGVYYLIK